MFIHKKSKSLVATPEQVPGLKPNDLPHKIIQPNAHTVAGYEGKKLIAFPLNFHTCATIHRASNARLPHHLGFPRGPIMSDYHWPSKYPKPMEHQAHTADFLTWYKRAFVFNEIGTAKTLSTLWAADYLRRLGLVRRVLILSTLSTLQRVWSDEIFENLIGESRTVLHGNKAKRIREFSCSYDYYIINHEGIKVIQDELRPRLAAGGDIDLIIVDEGAEFSNSRTGKFNVLQDLIGPQHTHQRVWWLTGSPMPGAPTDIWSQSRIICPDRVPKHYSHFRNAVMSQHGQYKYVPRKGWQRYIITTVQPAIRFERSECMDLPPCTTITREVEMSDKQRRAYTVLKKELAVELADSGGVITALNEGVKLMKLIQITTGAVFDREGKNHIIDSSPKIAALKELIREAGDKAIIFMPFKAPMVFLTQELSKTWSVGLVNGDVSAGARDRIFNEFQHGDLQLLIAHPKTMAHGLTLTACNIVIWYGPAPSFRIYEQAVGRITRAGQTRPQTIVHLVCSNTEKLVYKRHQNNDNIQGILLDLLAGREPD